ncbi:hypothetical protein [Virgibacillus pantothenticus]|uniref:hypothetical protein n=1 Tax=Virgibacillus pantothenticus TaxID=1473 RepID=UPI001BB01FE4|nr:hypothetical protein [Virgibacillus pantothenticus]
MFWIMFKHGKKDVQKTLFDQDQSFPGYVMDMLQKSWADDFYRFIFSRNRNILRLLLI